MNNVIPFPRDRQGSVKDRSGIAAGEMGQILLFLGVRYERHADQDVQTAHPDGQDRDSGAPGRRRKVRRRA